MKMRMWTGALLLAVASWGGAAVAGGAMDLFAEGFDLVRAGKLKEASAKFEQGLKAEPGNALAHYYLAETYLGLKQKDKARAHYQKALELDPNGEAGRDARERLAQLAGDGKGYAPGSEFRDCDTCPVMVVVPPGQFIMGSPPSEVGREDDEGPPHIVKMGKPFAVGKFEVTFAQWDACVADSGCDGYRPVDRGWGRDKRPVINVSWNDAQAYVQWLSRKTGKTYRLPSEAEWEYACRAGQQTEWCGQDSVENLAWYWDNSGKQTHPVGQKRANAWGLHDMSGNVWEWVEDCYHGSYQGAPTDGSVWEGGDCSQRVFRGGSWNYTPALVRLANRYWFGPSERDFDLGFRVARTLP